MATAEEKRREVLRRIQDTCRHPTGPRLHESMTKSRSVRPEVYMLEQLGLIEPCDRDGERGWKRTAAGDEYLKGHR